MTPYLQQPYLVTKITDMVTKLHPHHAYPLCLEFLLGRFPMCVYTFNMCMYIFSLQASLERIGVDSKGTVYWYDGGKNMFQSPPSNDPAYKPRYGEFIPVRQKSLLVQLLAFWPCLPLLGVASSPGPFPAFSVACQGRDQDRYNVWLLRVPLDLQKGGVLMKVRYTFWLFSNLYKCGFFVPPLQ